MGSIDRRADGKYRARWREYPQGPQRTKQFDRRRDAERYLAGVQHDISVGRYVDPTRQRTTVADYYSLWSPRQPWRQSSRASIESIFAVHVLPAFGARAVGSVRRGDVEAWAAQLPLAARTAGLAVQHVGTMFEAAIADGFVASNPARGAKRPKVDATPVQPLTRDELDRLIDASHDWFRVAVTLGAAVGLRQSEATGLRVEKVDFMRREVTVDQQLVTPPAGEPTLGPLKTTRSYRTVPLADFAVAVIAQHVEDHGPGEGGLLLHENGRPVRRQRFGQVWRSLRKRAGLEQVRFHDTRHTYGSMLLSGGVSVAAVADYMGHSPTTLLRTYAHLMPADHDRARSAVEEAFSKTSEDFLRTKQGP